MNRARRLDAWSSRKILREPSKPGSRQRMDKETTRMTELPERGLRRTARFLLFVAVVAMLGYDG